MTCPDHNQGGKRGQASKRGVGITKRIRISMVPGTWDQRRLAPQALQRLPHRSGTVLNHREFVTEGCVRMSVSPRSVA